MLMMLQQPRSRVVPTDSMALAAAVRRSLTEQIRHQEGCLPFLAALLYSRPIPLSFLLSASEIFLFCFLFVARASWQGSPPPTFQGVRGSPFRSTSGRMRGAADRSEIRALCCSCFLRDIFPDLPDHEGRRQHSTDPPTQSPPASSPRYREFLIRAAATDGCTSEQRVYMWA